LVLLFSIGLDLIVRADSCQACAVVTDPVTEHIMRRIINSTYIPLDGVIQDPQDWPGNDIEPDGSGLKVQTDCFYTAAVSLRRKS